jgi:hypothetical protein
MPSCPYIKAIIVAPHDASIKVRIFSSQNPPQRTIAGARKSPRFI